MKTKMGVLIVLFLAIWGIQATPPRIVTGKVTDAAGGSPIPGVNVSLKGTSNGTVTSEKGDYRISVPDDKSTLVFSFIGYVAKEVRVGTRSSVNVQLSMDVTSLQEVVVKGMGEPEKEDSRPSDKGTRHKSKDGAKVAMRYQPVPAVAPGDWQQPDYNTEEYDGIAENIFHGAMANPLSTFSIDVDAASYSNVRRFINNGQKPPKDAVRIEEMINYFDYDYQQPQGEDPFAIYTEISVAPWNEKHKLVHIGLQGKEIPSQNLPPSNLVFLIDVSGSMSDPNKLPLLKASFKLLTQQLRPQDQVAIVVYAGAAGVVLPSTSGANKSTIIKALDELQSGGSTAGGAGIRLAYAIAKENLRKEGNNRVIIATDGDFNVGESVMPGWNDW
jgi:Ca-activated chloride channel family protein